MSAKTRARRREWRCRRRVWERLSPRWPSRFPSRDTRSVWFRKLDDYVLFPVLSPRDSRTARESVSFTMSNTSVNGLVIALPPASSRSIAPLPGFIMRNPPWRIRRDDAVAYAAKRPRSAVSFSCSICVLDAFSSAFRGLKLGCALWDELLESLLLHQLFENRTRSSGMRFWTSTKSTLSPRVARIAQIAEWRIPRADLYAPSTSPSGKPIAPLAGCHSRKYLSCLRWKNDCTSFLSLSCERFCDEQKTGNKPGYPSAFTQVFRAHCPRAMCLDG